jgi:hypothetical protein
VVGSQHGLAAGRVRTVRTLMCPPAEQPITTRCGQERLGVRLGMPRCVARRYPVLNSVLFAALIGAAFAAAHFVAIWLGVLLWLAAIACFVYRLDLGHQRGASRRR